MAELQGLTVAAIRKKARNDAHEVLETFWDNTLPVDPIAIARSLGASVFNAQLGDDTWGMLIGGPSGADIYLDRDQPINRYRFSCAHEVGHLIDHQDELADGRAFIDKRSEDGNGRADEIYANEFAASLLMPEAHLKKWFKTLDTFDLAQKFEVSLDAVAYRCRLLRLKHG